MPNSWVYRVADGQLMMGRLHDAGVYPADSVNYALVTLEDSVPQPSPRLHRAASASAVRDATSAEMTTYDQEVADKQADASYKDKDVLAMVAVILEKTDTAFNTTDTNATQRTKVVAAAVRFNQRRKWVERNYSAMNFPS